MSSATTVRFSEAALACLFSDGASVDLLSGPTLTVLLGGTGKRPEPTARAVAAPVAVPTESKVTAVLAPVTTELPEAEPSAALN